MVQRLWEAKCWCSSMRKKCLWRKSKCSNNRILRTQNKLTPALTSNQMRTPEAYRVSFLSRARKAPKSLWADNKSINHRKEYRSRPIINLYSILLWNKKYRILLCSTQARVRSSSSLKVLKTQSFNRGSDCLCKILCRLNQMFINRLWGWEILLQI